MVFFNATIGNRKRWKIQQFGMPITWLDDFCFIVFTANGYFWTELFWRGRKIAKSLTWIKAWKVCAPTVVSPLVWCCTQLLLVGSVTIEIYTNVLWVEPSSRPSLPRMFDCHHCHHPKNIAPINWWALGMSFFFPDFQFMEGPNFGFCISHVCLRFEWAMLVSRSPKSPRFWADFEWTTKPKLLRTCVSQDLRKFDKRTEPPTFFGKGTSRTVKFFCFQRRGKTLPAIIMEVKNGGPSNNSSYLSNIAIFHWTMIMGERVWYSFTNT